ncbi:M48 family metallopeptidase [Arcicella rosea]|uniref:Tetratricopeptide (TPR) repeat protein n=1 Tax=Arcicella rosea TaxID=502909 RepID=A0A841EZR7_9BACT|nr:hypothetical protein [Arcicella rosea]MBB6005001.1 tetratricopeptide (TPR) repeat protein [Arcicella rosea]
MLERIESYFNNTLSNEERQLFETQLANDTTLANEVAFYLNTKIAARENAKEKRKQEFEELRKKLAKNNKIRLNGWITGIAASVLIAFITWVFVQKNGVNADEIADVYIQEHFENLPVKMDGSTDSLQMGLRFFNQKAFNNAQSVFEEMLERKPDSAEVLKVSGITALKLGDYQKAVIRFHELGEQENLFANPGKFYEALALMKIKPLNKKAIEELLNEVINNDLEGKQTAIEILKQL